MTRLTLAWKAPSKKRRLRAAESEESMTANTLGAPSNVGPHILEWVREIAAMTQPKNIHFCDGSEAEDQAMRALIVSRAPPCA
jgi:GTP-dependent phosphoenolpyruvate carboxykinase